MKSQKQPAWLFRITGAMPVSADTAAQAKKLVADHVAEIAAEWPGAVVTIVFEDFGKMDAKAE